MIFYILEQVFLNKMSQVRLTCHTNTVLERLPLSLQFYRTLSPRLENIQLDSVIRLTSFAQFRTREFPLDNLIQQADYQWSAPCCVLYRPYLLAEWIEETKYNSRSISDFVMIHNISRNLHILFFRVLATALWRGHALDLSAPNLGVRGNITGS